MRISPSDSAVTSPIGIPSSAGAIADTSASFFLGAIVRLFWEVVL